MTLERAENSVPIVVNHEPVLPFQLYESRPESITWHTIWDYELDQLVNISRPVTLGLSTMLVGAFLGLLPSVLDAFDLVLGGRPIHILDLVLAIISALCLAGGVVCGFFAYRGQIDALAVRDAVRTRAVRAVTAPQQGA